MNYSEDFCLNLDQNFYPASLPRIEFKLINFPAGESHIRLNNDIDYSRVGKVIISHRIKNGNDVMQLLLAHNALKRKGIKNFEIILPYFPYARQDRICLDGDAFSLEVFADMINHMNADKVYMLDIHSDVAPALVKNSFNNDCTGFISMAVDEINEPELYLVSPDTGANKRANKVFDSVGKFKDIIKCDKKRNLKDNSITNFEVFCHNIEKMTCLVFDDICDGGRTFMGIVNELKKKNAGDIYLYVTHGIFNCGIDFLRGYVKKIYCTNSYRDIDDPLVRQFILKEDNYK